MASNFKVESGWSISSLHQGASVSSGGHNKLPQTWFIHTKEIQTGETAPWLKAHVLSEEPASIPSPHEVVRNHP